MKWRPSGSGAWTKPEKATRSSPHALRLEGSLFCLGVQHVFILMAGGKHDFQWGLKFVDDTESKLLTFCGELAKITASFGFVERL